MDSAACIEVGAQGPDFPAMTKCEFCDVTFRCDLDVSRHLTSDIHTRNRESFSSNYSQKENKTTKKDVPKTLSQVLQLLKIKSNKDVEHLADRAYFKIANESQAILASEFSRYLLKTFIHHASKDLPPEVRHQLAQAAETNDETPEDSVASSATELPPSVSARPASSSSVSTAASRTVATASAGPKSSKAMPASKNKSPESRPPPAKTVIETSTPAQASVPVAQSTASATRQSKSSKKPNEPFLIWNPTTGAPTKTAAVPAAPGAPGPRPTTAAPRSVQEARQTQRPTTAPAVASGQRQTVTAAPRAQSSSSSSITSSSSLPRLATNAPPMTAAPKKRVELPQQQQQSLPVTGPPQPKKDSQYKPNLAIIKIEPKNN